uniref:CAAX prenyl protease 2 n=1 Tax=Mesocestoides corti TaxID=53468 RepID=A0A5K3FLA7_MESCO
MDNPPQQFPTKPLIRCPAYCLVFVSSLYIYGGFNRQCTKNVRRRLISAVVSCALIFLDTLTFLRCSDSVHSGAYFCDLSKLFLKWENLGLALLLPSLATSLLFLAPLWHEYLSGRFSPVLDYLVELRGNVDLCWLRTVVVAPLVEEVIFRGCILFHLQRQFSSCAGLCTGSAILFALSHFHHVIEKVYDGRSLKAAVLEVLPQVLMTGVFGIYSTLIVLRTGHLAAACSVHSLCNAMGMPDFRSEFYLAGIRDGRRGRLVYASLLVCGVLLWLVLIGPATTLFGLSDSTVCRVCP